MFVWFCYFFFFLFILFKFHRSPRSTLILFRSRTLASTVILSFSLGSTVAIKLFRFNDSVTKRQAKSTSVLVGHASRATSLFFHPQIQQRLCMIEGHQPPFLSRISYDFHSLVHTERGSCEIDRKKQGLVTPTRYQIGQPVRSRNKRNDMKIFSWFFPPFVRIYTNICTRSSRFYYTGWSSNY